MNLYVNTVLCMIIGDRTNKYVITCFPILNKILIKSNINPSWDGLVVSMFASHGKVVGLRPGHILSLFVYVLRPFNSEVI